MSASSDHTSPAVVGAGAPQIATFAAAASASTTSGVPRATAHHRQPTRQRSSRAPHSRYPARPSVRPMTTSAATSGPQAKNGVGDRPSA
jgi:hypothetical protein